MFGFLCGVALGAVLYALLGWLLPNSDYRRWVAVLDERDELRRALSRAQAGIRNLEQQLADARKNDRRNPKTGRYEKAAD